MWIQFGKAMEGPQPETKTEEREEAGPFEKLPAELLAYLSTFLTSAPDSRTAVRAIQAFIRSHMYPQAVLSDSGVMGQLITLISDRFDEDPLEIAFLFNNPGALEWLKTYFKKNPEATVKAEPYLFNALRSHKVDLFKVLLDAGVDPNVPEEVEYAGNTPLIVAIWKLSLKPSTQKMIEVLIKAGADVNKPNLSGDTPLILAAEQEGYGPIVQLLIDAGADLNKTDNMGNAPLMAATSAGRQDIAQRLLKAGANVNEEGKYGGALHQAVENNHEKLVKLLLEAGADVNKVGNGQTPLHIAALKGNSEILKLLLDAGADVSKVNFLGDTPLSVARYPRIAKLIESYAKRRK
jgi:ankyrin repeat protein